MKRIIAVLALTLALVPFSLAKATPALPGGPCGPSSVASAVVQGVDCDRYGDYHRVTTVYRDTVCVDWYHHDWVACEDGTVYDLAVDLVASNCYPTIV